MAAPEKPPNRPFNYTLDRRLAAGGMGEVYLARDKASGQVCVIKRMLPSLMSDAQFVTMFLDEARLVAQLNHPNIAPLYDFGMGQGVLFLAMEYVPGANLRVIVKDHAQRKAKLPFEPVARILSQAALALEYAHGAKTVDGKPLNLIHRDVSPQNILLSTAGVVKLIDFGVAKAATSSQQTAAGLIKGKYAYMSPEQLRGQALDGRSDIYGLGLVLYELLASERAIPGKTDAEVAQNALHMRFAPIEVKRPDLPERLKQIVNRALAKDVRERYQRAAELSSDLERFLADRRMSPSAAELARLLPAATTEPMPPVAVPPPVMTPPPSVSETKSFWERGSPSRTQAPTDDGLPPTQQLTPSQLPMKSSVVDPSEAPTAFAEDLKLPPPPLPPRSPSVASTDKMPPVGPAAPAAVSETALRRAIRRSLQPLVLSSIVLVLGAIALAWGFLLLNRRTAAPPAVVEVPVAKPPAPVEVAAPKPPAPVEVAVPTSPAPVEVAAQKPPDPPPSMPAPAVPSPAPAPVEAPRVNPAPVVKPAAAPATGAATVSVVSSVPARVSVDGATNGRAPLEVSLTPGAHSLVFEDLATGLKHKRAVTVVAGERRKEAWNPERGKLVVRASPWAEIFVGDHSFGVTPLEAIDVVAGRHNFRFVNTDTKRTVQRVVDVAAGRETLVKVDLR